MKERGGREQESAGFAKVAELQRDIRVSNRIKPIDRNSSDNEIWTHVSNESLRASYNLKFVSAA